MTTTPEAVAAAGAFADSPYVLVGYGDDGSITDLSVDREALAKHLDAFSAARVAAAVAAERTRIRDRLIRKALELRCEAGKHTTARVFHEIVACAATLERFAAELEKEDCRD